MNNMTTVVALKKADYQKLYRDRLLADFNHGLVTKGAIQADNVTKAIASLNEKMQKQGIAIYFDTKKVETQLEGGSCTVLALELADMVVNNFESETLVADSIAFVEKRCREVNNSNKKGSGCRASIRSKQMAFNTIVVDMSAKVDSFAQEKIRALVAYFDLSVSYSTKQMNVDDLFTEREFGRQLSKLDPGVYLMRLIQAANNHKLELKGHTALYIKTPKQSLYFDVNFGFYDVSDGVDSTDRKTNLIFSLLMRTKKHFGLDYYHFHKLQRSKD